jgi:mutator protein MutT
MCYDSQMNEIIDIHKAAGIIIRDRKLLVERSKGKEFFIAPGGSIEPGETPKQALVRELLEEFQITVNEGALTVFGTFRAMAAGQESRTVEMEVFVVGEWEGEPTPDNEVEELRWITSQPDGIQVGSIFEHEVIPRLKAADLID